MAQENGLSVGAYIGATTVYSLSSLTYSNRALAIGAIVYQRTELESELYRTHRNRQDPRKTELLLSKYHGTYTIVVETGVLSRRTIAYRSTIGVTRIPPTRWTRSLSDESLLLRAAGIDTFAS